MNRAWKEDIKTLIPGERHVHAKIATTTSGTLASTYLQQYGLKVTKTATKTGRYTLQLIDHLGAAQNARGFVNGVVNLIVADDAALTTTKGLGAVFRDDDIGTGANDGTIEVQLVQTNAGNADTEVQDGAILCITLILADATGP